MALVHRLNFSTFGRGIFQSLSGLLGVPFVGIQGIIKGVVNNDWSHPLGNRILTQLTDSPGLHYRELQRRLGAANGTLRHRLRKMEENGDVFAQRTNGRLCYFAGPPIQLEILEGIEVNNNARASSLLPIGLSKLQRRIVSELIGSKIYSTQADLARSIGRSRSAVNSAVMVLRQRGIVHIEELRLEDHLSCLSNPMLSYGLANSGTDASS